MITVEEKTVDPSECSEIRRRTLVSLTSVPQFCVFIVPIIRFAKCCLIFLAITLPLKMETDKIRQVDVAIIGAGTKWVERRFAFLTDEHAQDGTVSLPGEHTFVYDQPPTF